MALALCPSPSLASPSPPLPRLASTVLPPPEPAAVNELDAAIAGLVSAKREEREAASARLHDAGGALVPAAGKKLSDLRKSMNREAVGTVIDEARKQARRGGEGGDAKHDAPDDNAAGGDWLSFLYAVPKPTDPAYRDAVTVLAISRALVDVGTTPAVRVLLDEYLYFGDLFRIDLQRRVAALGDRAVPALIEARKHDAEKMRRWASHELDLLGRAIPGEAVQVADPQVLADVLRAFGRTKDIDALRVVVSFTSSDRVQVRDAAREAVTSFGEAAVWQLREAYESLTGQRPTPGSTWDKIALDLYAAHDRARLAEVYGLFDEGLEKQKAGKHDEAADQFDRVLARAPTFDRRAEMAPTYAALARATGSDDLDRALLLARKALRLDPEGPDAKSLASFVATLEGERLVTRGLGDTVPFKRALELDPSNGRARSDLVRLESGAPSGFRAVSRYLAAAVIALVGIGAAFLIGVAKRASPAAPLPVGGLLPPPDAGRAAEGAPAPADPAKGSNESNADLRPDGPPTGVPRE